jgi:hypothetical protein
VLGANQSTIIGLLVDRTNASVLAPLRTRAFQLMRSPAVARLAGTAPLQVCVVAHAPYSRFYPGICIFGAAQSR